MFASLCYAIVIFFDGEGGLRAPRSHSARASKATATYRRGKGFLNVREATSVGSRRFSGCHVTEQIVLRRSASFEWSSYRGCTMSGPSHSLRPVAASGVGYGSTPAIVVAEEGWTLSSRTRVAAAAVSACALLGVVASFASGKTSFYSTLSQRVTRTFDQVTLWPSRR